MLRNSASRYPITRCSSLKTVVNSRPFSASTSVSSPLKTTTLDDSLETFVSAFPVETVSEPNRYVNNNNNNNTLTSNGPISVLKYLQQQTNLNPREAATLLEFSTENFTAEDYSTFVNRLFDLYKKGDRRLKSLRTWNSLYHIYRVFIVNNIGLQGLNAMMLHDMNEFIKILMDLGDLPSARGVFQLILKNSENGEIPNDTEIINTFLRLYCGALNNKWRDESTKTRAFYQHLILSVSKSESNSVYYPTIGVPQFQSLLRKLLEQPEYATLRNTEMDSLIIKALGHHKEVSFLKKYLTLLYGVGENGKTIAVDASSHRLTPDSKLLSSILIAFAHNKELGSGIRVVEELLSKNPDIALDAYFWRTLMKCSIRSWNKLKDKQGTLPTKAWNMMKSYYTSRGKPVPFDRKTMLLRFYFVKSTKNSAAAMDDVKQVFQTIFYKTEKNTFMVERVALYQYQKFILKDLVECSENSKCIDFINEWKIDHENGVYLENYFKELTEAKANEHSDANKLNDGDDDDFNFPMLGTNIL
ncbi:hypothetical protein KLMA_80044 [Kluyveromyces marxianus]|nr:hypothetical protein KLMA_80044 [Kluyveromyces marxianus]